MKTFFLNLLSAAWAIIASFFAFFLPCKGILIAVGVAIAFDTGTGVFKAWKLGGWKAVRSRPASDFAGKSVLYCLCVLSIYTIDHYIIGEFMRIWFSIDYAFTKVVAMVLILIELKSMLENFEEATKTEVWPLLRNLFKRSREVKEDITNIIS